MPLQNQHSRRRAWSSVSAAGCVLCKRRLLKLSLQLSTRCCAPACVVVCLRSAFARFRKRGRDHPSLPHTTPRSSGYLLHPSACPLPLSSCCAVTFAACSSRSVDLFVISGARASGTRTVRFRRVPYKARAFGSFKKCTKAAFSFSRFKYCLRKHCL